VQRALRLAYSCHDTFPSADTNTQQIFWTVIEVARLGARVELLIPSVAPDASANPRAVIGAYYGASTDSIPADLQFVPGGDRPARTWIAKGLFDWHVPQRVTRGRHDLIWTRDLVAAAACARAGLPVVFETYRPDIATRRRFAPWRSICFSSPHVRGFILHSQVAAAAFIDAGAAPDRCVVAHNGFAPSLMTPALDRGEARRLLGIPADRPLVVYAGHSGPEKGLDALIRMAAAAPQLSFLILGLNPDSGEADAIAREARAAGATNLLLRTRVRVSEVAPYLYAADCLIIPPSDEPLRRFRGTVMPMKLFMYLAAGRPILAPRLPDIEEMLRDGVTARLVPAGETMPAVAALVQLLEDRALQSRLSRNALDAAAQYTWDARARRLMDFFTRIAIPGASLMRAAS